MRGTSVRALRAPNDLWAVIYREAGREGVTVNAYAVRLMRRGMSAPDPAPVAGPGPDLAHLPAWARFR